MHRLAISFLACSLLIAAQPVLAKDYVLKLELAETRAESIVSKLGAGRPYKSSDLRTVEILVTPGQPFRSRTTWLNDELVIQGKLVEGADGQIALEIDCRKIETTSSRVKNTTMCSTKLGMELDKPIQLGGMETKSENRETPFTSRQVQSKTLFHVTVSEDRDP